MCLKKQRKRNILSSKTKFDKILKARAPLPSRDTPDGGNVWTWLKEKAHHESTLGGAGGNLWMVHGKWYDLNAYIDKHPGGPTWLRLTKGQDITEAFEVHHLNTAKAEAVLKSMYVKDASEDYTARYQWDDNGFYRTLKRRVRRIFGTRRDGRPDTGPTRFFIGLCIFAIGLHFLCYAAMLKWPGVLTAIIAGFTLQPFHGIGHNALHMKDNIWMYCYDFCGWKHHVHRTSHALSHHLHPNTPLDLEFPEPYSYVDTKNASKNSRLVILMGPWGMWSGPLRTILNLWLSLAKGEEAWRNEYIFNMLQLGILAWFHGPLVGFACFCGMHLMCGFCIETAGFALHRSSFCWSMGDPNEKYDYGEHCLASTADHDVDMPLVPSLYLFQILNNHGIHHLFPAIDKSRIPEIMPIFRQTCKEFGLPWQENDWRDMFGSLWKNWLKGLYTDTPMITTPPRGHVPVPGSSLRVENVKSKTIGAAITGVQISDLSEDEFKVIKKALMERAVVVIKNQDCTPQEQIEFSKRFPYSRTCNQMKFCGPLALEGFDAQEWRDLKMKDVPEIQLRGYADLQNYYGVTAKLNTGKGAKEFHSDSIHEYDMPPVITQLYCVATPGSYDHTLFIDCRLAYDLLSETEKEYAETLFVQYKRQPSPLHESGLKADFNAELSTLGDIYGSAVANMQSGEDSDQQDVKVSEVHPLVWTHPVTGRKAIVSAAMWMHRIVEGDGTPWTPEESHDYVYRLLKPVADLQYEHNWSPKDLVLFDNRSLMHSASSVPLKQGHRLLHQILLCGTEVPMGPAGSGVGNPVVNPNVPALR
jgi:alpha-ketoglutarate-dependent taurine dioxygenase/fatty acid desaturase